MKLNTILKNKEGVNYTQDDKDLTLRDVLGFILSVQKSNNPFKSYKLTNMVVKEDKVDLIPEDKVFLREIIEANARENPAFYPYVLGQVIELIEDEKKSN